MTSSNPEEVLPEASRPGLADVLKKCAGQKHIIAIRGFPDPDSIGSAMAHAFLCQNYDIETIILYFDDISHQENRALVKKLAIEMVRYEAKLDPDNFDGVVIVDSQLFQLPGRLVAEAVAVFIFSKIP